MDYTARETITKYLILFYFLLIITPVFAGSDLVFQSDNYSIRWIAQISKPADVNSGKSIFTKLSDLIFGERQQRFRNPAAALCLNSSDIIVLDQRYASLSLISQEKHQFTTFSLEEIPSAVGMAFLPPNRILITDSRLNRVIAFHIGKEEFIPLKLDREINQPTGIAVIPGSKQVWITETAAHQISIFDYKGKYIKSIGTRGTEPGQFNFPTFILNDNAGNIIINDAMNFRIQIMDTTGYIRSVFGEAGDASGFLARPKGIACDSHGHIYVVDALFNNVQVFDPDGNLLAYFGRKGRDKGEFWMPGGICIDKDDRIYVADTYNSRMQIFQLEKKH